jgi:hypothetical protein
VDLPSTRAGRASTVGLSEQIAKNHLAGHQPTLLFQENIMRIARTRPFVVTSLFVACSASSAWAVGVPTINWVVHDQTSNRMIEIGRPADTITLNGNHSFVVKLVVKGLGAPSDLAIGGTIARLRCGASGSSSSRKVTHRVLPQQVAIAAPGQPAELTLSFNGERTGLCASGSAGGGTADRVNGGTIRINGSSIDKRESQYRATGTLTIRLIPDDTQ